MYTAGPNFGNMYNNEGARYMVWYFDTFGWYKRYMYAWYAHTFTNWAGANFFVAGQQMGDYSPIVFAMFSADPGDVSTWTNYNGPTS